MSTTIHPTQTNPRSRSTPKTLQDSYAYGAGSGIVRQREMSPFYASSSVRANVTLEFLELFRELLQNYREAFTQADLDTTKNITIKRATRDFETLGGGATQVDHIKDLGYGRPMLLDVHGEPVVRRVGT